MIAYRIVPLLLVLFLLAGGSLAQNLEFERTRHKDILRQVKDDVKKNYFDPNFKGIDLEATYKAALDKLTKAESIGQMNGIIAQFLFDFDDSHLFFLPPGKANKTEYGIDFRMVADKCFVESIDKDSDAQKTGIEVGDEVLAIHGFVPTRDTMWKIEYVLKTLRPQPGLNLAVRKPDGKRVDYAIPAKIIKGKRVTDLTSGMDLNAYIRESESNYRKRVKQYYIDKIEGVFIWKMPSFSLESRHVDDIMGRVKKSPALILDLRGNGGGRVDMLLRLIGSVIDRDVKVGDEKTRKETKELIAKTRGTDAYAGKIIVLVDSGSASASEVFSRVMQLEKRGQVIGDRTAGAVMESRYYSGKLGLDTIIVFGTSVTIADLIMKDGVSLEKKGVTPDIVFLPTGKDLAAKRDVVLAAALGSIGITVTPEAAGAMFPDIDN